MKFDKNLSKSLTCFVNFTESANQRDREKSFRIFFFDLCALWMHLPQALLNFEIRPGTCFFEQITIFVTMGLYIVQVRANGSYK